MLNDPKYDAGFEYGWRDDRFKGFGDAIDYISKLDTTDPFNKGMINALMQRFKIDPETLRVNLKEMRDNPPKPKPVEMSNESIFLATRETDFTDPDLNQEKPIEFHTEQESSDKINSILDRYSNGEITMEQAKAMISEFSSSHIKSIKTGYNTFGGKLGL